MAEILGKFQQHVNRPVLTDRYITKVAHDIPVWYYPEKRCNFCGNHLRLQVARAKFIEQCVVMEVDGFEIQCAHPECYEEKIVQQPQP